LHAASHPPLEWLSASTSTDHLKKSKKIQKNNFIIYEPYNPISHCNLNLKIAKEVKDVATQAKGFEKRGKRHKRIERTRQKA